MNPAIAPAIRSLVSHHAVSSSHAVSAADLAEALSSGRVAAGSRAFVLAVLNEAETDTLVDLVIQGAATFGTLSDLADQLLDAGHPNREFLDAHRA